MRIHAARWAAYTRDSSQLALRPAAPLRTLTSKHGLALSALFVTFSLLGLPGPKVKENAHSRRLESACTIGLLGGSPERSTSTASPLAACRPRPPRGGRALLP